MWRDGALRSRGEAEADASEAAGPPQQGCYTTARWCGDRVRHGERCARRLARDAARLGLGGLDALVCARAMAELGAAAFGRREGVLRFEAHRDASGALQLLGVPRPLGEEPALWTAVSAPRPHPGPAPAEGAKRTGELHLTEAREHARAAGAQEALLFDAGERLVEGAHTNLFVVLEGGELVTPPLARGGVAGVARALLLEALAEAREADVPRAALLRAREIVATNAVRGARALVVLDGAPVGCGEPGPCCGRLAAVLDAAA